jgi:serine/threonine-protein kinase HipA
MRKVEVLMHGVRAGVLEEILPGKAYHFTYDEDYEGPPISLTMPVEKKTYVFERFPPFFEGLLPEGFNLEALLRGLKIDVHDLFSQLAAVGADTVGAVTVRAVE